MNHDAVLGAPAPDSRRGRQMLETIALQHMLNHDLPEIAYWSIDGETDGATIHYGLDGQLAVARRTPQERRAMVQEWAWLIGATVESRIRDTGREVLYAEATYRGVHVVIWCTARPDHGAGS